MMSANPALNLDQEYSLQQVASAWNVDRTTVWREIERDRLMAFKRAGVWRIKKSDLDAYDEISAKSPENKPQKRRHVRTGAHTAALKDLEAMGVI